MTDVQTIALALSIAALIASVVSMLWAVKSRHQAKESVEYVKTLSRVVSALDRKLDERSGGSYFRPYTDWVTRGMRERDKDES